MTTDSLDLLCIKYDGWQPRIRAATPKRAWMDATNERYAYRCLPLSIANSHGWELLSPLAFEAKWDGGDRQESVEVRMDAGYSEHLKPVTIFGYGTLTWHVECIFRTPPGWNLHVSGPPNRQKDAIQALSAVIETDWSPYTFTMNWRFTRADQWIRFEENEPIAHFFPVERGRVEQFRPRIERLEDHDDLRQAFEKWSASRNAFQKWVLEANPDAASDKWQKLYFRGLDADGRPGPADHQAKLRVPPFKFGDGTIMDPPEAKACPVRPPQPAAALTDAAPQVGAALLNPLAARRGIANPALTVALNRIGFDPQNVVQPQVREEEKVEPGVLLAVKRYEWIMAVEARQRALSPRANGIGRAEALTREDFLDHFYAPSRPVLIEGAMADWPALRLWTPDYLAAKVGSAVVEYQGDRDSSADFDVFRARHRRTLPFDQFIAAVQAAGFGNDVAMTDANAYANLHALAPLRADLGRLDSYLRGQAGMILIGPGGSFTPLHFSMTNQLVAQVTGSRRVLLAPPSETQRLYPRANGASEVHDLTDENRLARYPAARGTRTYEFELQAGELLYIPTGWWQQVTALDFSVAVAYTDFIWPNDGAASFPRA